MVPVTPSVEKIANFPAFNQACEPTIQVILLSENGEVVKNRCRRREVILVHFKVLSPNFLE